MKTRHPSSVSIKYEGKVIAENVTRANNFWTRLSGYIFRKRPHVSGILFEPAGAIQTTFIKFSLDVCRYTFSFNPQLSAISPQGRITVSDKAALDSFLMNLG